MVGPCTGCHNGSTTGLCTHPDQYYERACQDVLHAASLDGPFVRHNLTLRWDWLNVNLGLESHAPVVLENGTVLTFTRSYDAPKPSPGSSIWLVRADQWNGTYSIVGSQSLFKQDLEDTFMW